MAIALTTNEDTAGQFYRKHRAELVNELSSSALEDRRLKMTRDDALMRLLQHSIPVFAISRLAMLTAGTACAILSLAATAGAQPAPSSPGDRAPAELVGASVVSKDAALVGAVDDVTRSSDGHPQQLIVGLGGFLGVGEKDVAVPYEGIEVTATAPRRLLTGQGIYAGSKPLQVRVPVTLQQLLEAPRHQPQPGGVGAPSPNSGAPSNRPADQPPSSTESGGPG
jgi:hypothetical protein